MRRVQSKSSVYLRPLHNESPPARITLPRIDGQDVLMQRDVIAFLSTPAAYGLAAGPVDRIDTHISIVWLAADRAFKLKRAVHYDYVDFSTLELRRAACEAEIRLNRRTAPSLYLGVRAVTREADGSFALGGTGEPIEWLVEMQRFDQDTLFDRLAERGRLDQPLMEPLASEIVRLHNGANVRTDHGGQAGMAWVVEGNDRGLIEQGAGVLDPVACVRLSADTRATLLTHRRRLDARRGDGFVRECHGDLHLRNICLLDGAPTIFDGVEFNDDISCIDVLYDVAFLLMDLWRRGLRAHANVVLNEYVSAASPIDALCLMPLFLSCRAAVRAKTSVTAAAVQADTGRRQEMEAAARQYLDLAQTFLHPAPPRLIAIGGFSGSGKSTLARGLAPSVGAAPGALILRSDVIRKGLLGVPASTRAGADGYSPGMTQRVYQDVVARAGTALRAGQSVIADAVFAQADHREAIERTARDAGVPFIGLWIDGSREVLAQRIAHRSADASDATADVLEAQLRAGAGAVAWRRLDGGGSGAAVLADAQRAVA
jgi:aminoglycoside phosphotransferase family enzyme/predicted kinase